MRFRILSLIAFLAIVFGSCQNDEKLSSTDNSVSDSILKSAEIATSDVTVEGVLEEVNYEADFFAESERLLRALAGNHGHGWNVLNGFHCGYYNDSDFPTVSVDTAETGYPIVITIEFGDSTVIHHGTVVSGTVAIELSAPRDTDGATRTITYTDCKVDSVGIDGTSVEVFNGDLTSRKVSNSVDVTFVLADGTELQLTGSHVREWLSGLDTPLVHEDDSIQSTGSSEIVSSTGDSWSKEIIEPLIKTGACRSIVQGVVQYTMNDEVIATLDYGFGTCDNTATLTVDGEDIEIELHGSGAHADIDGRHRHQEGGH